jgi:Tol biopolymer transport system component
LPDGRHFLYLAWSPRPENRAVYVASLDGKVKKRVAIPVESAAVYAAASLGSGSGHLLFTRGETLMARPFDPRKLEVSGEAFSVAEQVARLGGTAGGSFSASANGVLSYRTGQAISDSELVWFDRDGKRLGTVGQPADYTNPSLSPDGKRLAVGRRDPQTKTRDLWLFDLVRGASSRLTFDPADDLNPVWSPDGRRIAFSSERKAYRSLYHKDATGVGGDEALLESDFRSSAEDWSSDGRFLLFNVQMPRTPTYVAALPLSGDRKPVPVLQGPFRQDQAQLSPNGRWVAYRSLESGRDEVYVQAFTPVSKVTGKWQVSTAGGWEPQWRRDGKELYYLTDTKLMAVEVKTDAGTFEAGTPKVLFEVRLASPQYRNRYITPDGRRFLIAITVEEMGTSPYNVVMNWDAGLKQVR